MITRWRQRLPFRATLLSNALVSIFSSPSGVAAQTACKPEDPIHCRPRVAVIVRHIPVSDILSATGNSSGTFALVHRGHKRVSLVRQLGNPAVVATPQGRPFRAIASVGWFGDTLYVVDQRPLEVLLYSALGAPLRSWRLQGAADSLNDSMFFVDGIFSDHTTFVEQRMSFDDAVDGRIATQVVSRLVRRDAPTFITRVNVNHRLMRIIFDDMIGQATLVQPFRDDDLFTLSPNGSFVVKVERRVQKKTAPSHFVVTSFRPDGQLRFSVKHAYRAIRTNSQAVDSVVRLLVDAIRRQSRFSRVSNVEPQIRMNLFVPSFFPSITHLLVSTDGSIWLERPDLHGDWQVLSAEGKTVSRVRVPPRVQLFAVSGRMLVGSFRSLRTSGDSVVLLSLGK